MPLGNIRNPSFIGTYQLQQESNEAPRTTKVKKRLSVTNGQTDTDLETQMDRTVGSSCDKYNKLGIYCSVLNFKKSYLSLCRNVVI